MEKFDIIVIGLGPAGMPVSTLGGLMGLKVLAIEKRKHGGECLNYGCIPSKFLVKASEAAYSVNSLDKFGLASSGNLDNSGVMKMLKKRVSEVSTIVREKDVFNNITYLNDSHGGKFVDNHTVRVGDKTFYGKKIFISVGTVPFIPQINGLDTIDKTKVLTNVELFEEDNTPKSLVIVGAGAMGLEIAQAFQ